VETEIAQARQYIRICSSSDCVQFVRPISHN